MNINSHSRIHHPLDQVYETYRNHLPDVARHMPDIERITTEVREDVADGVRLKNVWVARAKLPSFVQALVRVDALQWVDHAHWHDGDKTCDWRIEIPAFGDKVRCVGKNHFTAEAGGTTRVAITGELHIALGEFPGVPSLLARRAAPKVEEFIVTLITPNLEKTNEAVQRFLDAKR